MVNKALDREVGGNHYKYMKIQPIEFIAANKLDFMQGSIIKYICRYKTKGGIADLEKIKHFVDLIIELSTNEDNKRPRSKPEPDCVQESSEICCFPGGYVTEKSN